MRENPLLFPKRDEERQLLAAYHAEDSAAPRS